MGTLITIIWVLCSSLNSHFAYGEGLDDPTGQTGSHVCPLMGEARPCDLEDKQFSKCENNNEHTKIEIETLMIFWAKRNGNGECL